MSKSAMMQQNSSNERSRALGEAAINKIIELKLPATPRHYEVWYAYASGQYPSINCVIDSALTRPEKLTEVEVERIYSAYISGSETQTKIEAAGLKLADEVDQVMAMIHAATGSSLNYSKDLADATQQLELADSESLRAIVEGLIQSTAEAEAANKVLQDRLNTSRTEIQQLRGELQDVVDEAMTDPLTSLANRKRLDLSLASAVTTSLNKSEPASVLMIDIDHFKTFNDRYGHLTGDHVLRLVAATIKENVKGQDIAARYGGEEFALVLPNTALRSAVSLAEQIRRSVFTRELVMRETREPLGRITLSIGVALVRAGDTVQTVLGRADVCLYAAKRSGRNRVVCESDPEARTAA